MLKKGKVILGRVWRKNKTWSIFLIVTVVLHVILFAAAITDFVQLRKISGTIDDISLDRYKKELYLKLNINADENTYYQVYYKRFQEDQVFDLEKNTNFSFYTTKKKYRKNKAVLSNDPSSGFSYYPIFCINSKKSFEPVLLFHIYRNSIFTLLLYISLAGSLFYSIPYVTITNWRNRILVLCLVAIYVYLFY